MLTTGPLRSVNTLKKDRHAGYVDPAYIADRVSHILEQHGQAGNSLDLEILDAGCVMAWWEKRYMTEDLATLMGSIFPTPW